MTKHLRKTAAQANDSQMMSLWTWQGYHLAKDMPAEEAGRLLSEEMRDNNEKME
jgi:nitronate monooxygenase